MPATRVAKQTLIQVWPVVVFGGQTTQPDLMQTDSLLRNHQFFRALRRESQYSPKRTPTNINEVAIKMISGRQKFDGRFTERLQMS